MHFFPLYLQGLLCILGFMSILWLISVIIGNVSIVDPFWGLGFAGTGWFYFLRVQTGSSRALLLLVLLTIWGIRLSGYLAWRNRGRGEDFRYREFRRKYGERRYWWISFFQTFLLQGVLMWLISAPLLAVPYFSQAGPPGWLDGVALFLWIAGFLFEAGGDLQLARFKADERHRGRVLQTGFWKYTRHPNYFGDAAIWWAYGLFAAAAGSLPPLASSLLMTLLLLRVSGVALLEKTLRETKPAYREYAARTSAFIPWFPRRAGGAKGRDGT
ncbi:DUF1295 domain-containing protein [bacterium]|nr:DUF1295 domain-containing protein [bacterium]